MPHLFLYMPQAAQDNHFMHSSATGTSGRAGGSVTHRALREFAGLHHELTEVWGLPFRTVVLCSGTLASLCRCHRL